MNGYDIPEPVRALGWHVLYAGVAALAIGLVFGAGVLAVINLGAFVGIAITLALAAVAVGAGVWWIDGGERP